MHDQLPLQRPQPTSQKPADQSPPEIPRQAGPRGDDGPVLRFGFTYQHVEALARRAVRDHYASRGRDFGDRYEAAWGSAVECLYSTREPVSSLDLIKAARRGLSRLAKRAMRDRGYDFRRPDGGGAVPLPSFWRYWTSPGPASVEETAVEAAALEQVMARLSPAQAAALRALAEHGSHQAAAAALGISVHSLDTRLHRARAAFLALWHEHEAPSRKRRDTPLRLRQLRSQPGTQEEEAGTLAAVAEAFGDRIRMPSRDLLAALAAADPARYGDWDPYDLAGFLRRHQVPRHSVDLYDGPQRDGRGGSARGYWLAEVIAALDHLAGAVPELAAAA